MTLWGELSFVGHATCFDPEAEGARHSYGDLCAVGDSCIDEYGISSHLHTFGGVAGASYAASMTTGMVLSAMMIRRRARVSSPRFVPIGAARGMTVAQPTSSRRLQSTGSACT